MNAITIKIINSLKIFNDIFSFNGDLETDYLFTPIEEPVVQTPIDIIQLNSDSIKENFGIITKYPFQIVTNTAIVSNGKNLKVVELRTLLSLNEYSHNDKLVNICRDVYDSININGYCLKGLIGRLMLYSVIPENELSLTNIKNSINLLETIAKEYRNQIRLHGFTV